MTERSASPQIPEVVDECPPASGPAPARAAAAASFRAIFERESSYVCNSLRRLGIGDADVQDLAHEVFVALYRRIQAGSFDAERPAGPWLVATAFRIASDHRRLARHQREVFGGEPPTATSAAPPADELLAAEQDRALLLAALDRVPLERRVVLVMHDVDGHAMPEIAEALEIPLNTAYSRLRVARQELKRALSRLAPDRMQATAEAAGDDASADRAAGARRGHLLGTGARNA
jgi:RNA polymerase sigma-70 factor (ECF subfamily)